MTCASLLRTDTPQEFQGDVATITVDQWLSWARDVGIVVDAAESSTFLTSRSPVTASINTVPPAVLLEWFDTVVGACGAGAASEPQVRLCCLVKPITQASVSTGC